MSKLITATLFLLLILSLAACASPEEDFQITVSAYDTMIYGAFLEEAAKLFMEKNPGTRVNIETFSALPEIKTDGQGMIMAVEQDDSQARQDYLNKINTALMSGEGADILAIDILPFYKYADSGQLESLAPYMQADPEFSETGYPPNILNAMEYKGSIWFLPLDYSFNFYTNYIADPSELPSFTKGPFPDMWELLLAENYAAFVDFENKAANFTDGSFEELLASVKRYGEGGLEQVFYNQKSAFSLISFFTRDLGVKTTALGEGGTMAVGDDEKPRDIVANANGSVAFTYRQAYAINADSKNKETAWAFIKFLLGEEMQLSGHLPPHMLPLDNTARAEKLNTVLTGITEQSQPALNQAIGEAIEEYTGQINTYIIRDAIIDHMIDSEVQYFFEGAKTAAQVAEALQNKVGLYLNE